MDYYERGKEWAKKVQEEHPGHTYIECICATPEEAMEQLKMEREHRSEKHIEFWRGYLSRFD